MTIDGPGLPYVATRVDVKPRTFHPKLIVLEYEDRFRVAVSSANLTRPAWTSLLELFVIEDLAPGDPHPWSAPLRGFLGHLERFLAPERRADVMDLCPDGRFSGCADRLAERLAELDPGKPGATVSTAAATRRRRSTRCAGRVLSARLPRAVRPPRGRVSA